MRQAERARILKALRHGLDTNTSVDAGGILRAPVTDFTCKELLAREQEIFFRQTPLLMGLSTDLPQPGSYVATAETGVAILLTRDTQGQFRAFLNVCSHRGMQVVEEGRGVKHRFTCPFHAWTYKNSGELIAIAREDRFGCIDKGEHGLVELPAAEKYGLLWVRPSPGDPIDIDAQLGGLAEDMEAWQLPTHAFSEAQVIDAEINWKLAIDTFGENYHFDVLHKQTLANDIHGNLQTQDIFGRNYRMVFAQKGGFKYVADNNMPLEQWPYRWITLNVYFIYPNVIFLVDPAGVDVLRMYPDAQDPARSRTHHSYYANPELAAHLEQQGIEAGGSRFVGFNMIVVDEDFAAATHTQRNALSGARSHYIFGRNEPALHHYHNVHREGLGLPPLELEQA
ncbi:MAG: SRPBCC family protein [Pseudomonadota bacterium]